MCPLNSALFVVLCRNACRSLSRLGANNIVILIVMKLPGRLEVSSILSKNPFMFHSFVEEFLTKTTWRTNLDFIFKSADVLHY